MYLRDPVHGLIGFDAPEDDLVTAIIDTAEVQRLRRVRQLGVTCIAFHGAEHTRFSHAVGAAHVMKRLLGGLGSSAGDVAAADRLTPDRIRDAVAAALVHDLGHGPFSHLFEEVLPRARTHEEWTAEILLDRSTEVHRALSRFGTDRPERIVSILRGSYEPAYLSRAISGPLDVDRCDYLLRDSHMTGVRYGVYDLDWLLRSQRLARTPEGRTVIALDGQKGLAAIEEYFTARLFMFQQVYLHKTTRAVEWMIQSILKRVAWLVREGRAPEPLPAALARSARGEPIALAEYLELDDSVLFAAFGTWARRERDPILRDLCARVLARRLFKTLEIRDALTGTGEVAERATDSDTACIEREVAHAREVASGLGLDPEYYVGLDRAVSFAYGEPDEDGAEEVWVLDRKGTLRPLADVSLIIGRLRGLRAGATRLIVGAEVREAMSGSAS